MAKFYCYLHTHWDREWYLPFESYRAGLVTITRQLVNKLQKGELPSFYFDGQAVALEDAVALDPSLKGDLTKLLKSGVIQAGPWYVLNDQMLVSGESVIRNLSHGMKVVRKFAQPVPIGYCPDTFGHSQDLPRILKGFGIEVAVVWRGVPDFYDAKNNGGLTRSAPLFIWESPDGSQVLAHHLTRGYYQTAFHEKLPTAELAKSLLSWLDNETNYNYWTDGVLVPVGGDHLATPENFNKQLNDLNDWFGKSGQHSVVPLSLVSYLKQFGINQFSRNQFSKLDGAQLDIGGDNLDLDGEKCDLGSDKLDESEGCDESEDYDLPLIAGELRDNKATSKFERAFLLPGVLSSRLYLKRANRVAENALVNKVEPLCTLLNAWGIMEYPHQLIDHAWELLLKNHPHDSICGCSVDAVHQEMMTRYKRIEAIVESIETKARQAICLDAAVEMHTVSASDPDYEPDAILVMNLGGQLSSGVVELDFNTKITDALPNEDIVQITSSSQEDKLFAGPDLLTYYKVVNAHKSYIYAQEIPPLGFKLYDWPSGSPTQAGSLPKSSFFDMAVAAPPVVASSNVMTSSKTISNGLIDLSVDAEGVLVVRCQTQDEFVLGHNFIDYGDAGDTYTFDPVPGDKPVSATFISAGVAESGPMVSTLLLQYEINIPEQVEFDCIDGQAQGQAKRSGKLSKHIIATKVSLRRGSPIVYFETEFDNKAKDHRLEVVFNSGSAIDHSYSENHFSLVRRRHNIDALKLPVGIGQEATLDKFPCQRFFIAGNQLFLNKGLPEYAINKGEVSLTILRAVSMLSRGAMSTRGGGAGPHMELEEANCLGLNKVSYAWSPLPDEDCHARAYNLAELYESRLWAVLVKKSELAKKQGFPDLTKSNAGRRPENNSERLSEKNYAFIKTVAMYSEPHANNVILRLLNIDMQPHSFKLDLGLKFNKMHTANLAGQVLQSRSIKRVQSVDLEFAANELKTLIFSRK